MSRPRFLADHDLNEHILDGVLRREPAVEFVRARDVGLSDRPDPEVLEHAAAHDVHPARGDQQVDPPLQHQDRGYIYTRWGNPTIRAAEETVASLEGADTAALFASGMGAIATTLLALLQAGDEIVAPHSLYGGSYHLIEEVLPRCGIRVRFVDVDELPRVRLAAATKVVFFEPVTNPTLRVVPVADVVAACRGRGVHVVVDNTLATPINLKPLALGADLVIHSATKYLGGHSDLVAGVVSGSRDLVERVRVHSRYLGANFNPREAWLMARGMKTLALRVRRQNESALTLARWLSARSEVRRVWHPFLAGHPEHDLARRQLKAGGGLVTFEVEDLAAAKGVVDRLTLWRKAASLGGVESLVSIPVLTSHWNVPPDGLARAGITPGTVRLSVGVEDPADLQADLEQALQGLAVLVARRPTSGSACEDAARRPAAMPRG